jgi:hypothetical protein
MLLGRLTAEELEETERRLAVAINSGKLVNELHGPPH